MTTTASLPWWKSYFTAHYGHLYKGPFKEELSTDREAITLGRLFAEARGPILDVCCGYGRHMKALEDSGLRVYGVDYSEDLIDMLPKRLSARVARGDARRLPFRSQSLAGAYLLFNSFGYFEDGENQGLLEEIARVLKPGSPFVLDLPSRSGMRHVVKEMPSSIRCQDDMQVYESWWLENGGKRLEGHGLWEVDGLAKKNWELSIRLYTPSELTRLLRKAGFQGEVEIRPLGEFDFLGTGLPAPSTTDGRWRRATNMAVLAYR